MRDKALKFKKGAGTPNPEREAMLRERLAGDECKVQFILWSDGCHLDIAGICDDEGPVFRPAACAWEAWKAAWSLKSKRTKKKETP